MKARSLQGPVLRHLNLRALLPCAHRIRELYDAFREMVC